MYAFIYHRLLVITCVLFEPLRMKVNMRKDVCGFNFALMTLGFDSTNFDCYIVCFAQVVIIIDFNSDVYIICAYYIFIIRFQNIFLGGNWLVWLMNLFIFYSPFHPLIKLGSGSQIPTPSFFFREILARGIFSISSLNFRIYLGCPISIFTFFVLVPIVPVFRPSIHTYYSFCISFFISMKISHICCLYSCLFVSGIFNDTKSLRDLNA